ncbi:PrsW family glutamic-type intramembrane protease [Actinomycetaceae bacterium MB13-C1-2]|nr:PrsW family glutamic-type intramembrane protease [Actinomycetaceae bacterium MB13-C1-2]
MNKHSKPPQGRAGGPLLLAAGSIAIAMILAYIVGAFLPVTSAKESPQVTWWMTVLTVVAFFVAYPGCVAALAWWTRRVQVDGPPNLKKAIWVGIGSGLFALVISYVLEEQTHFLPGWLGGVQGGNVVTGFIEEGTKLLIPVLLMGTVVFRNVLTGFWTVFTSAATFGLVEGALSFIGGIYDPNPPTPGYSGGWVEAVNALNITGEAHHILYTAPAAALIWYAAARLSRGRAWAVGIGAFLVAGVLHAVNDGVLAQYLSGANAIYVVFGYGVLMLLTWYCLSVRKLTPPEITAQSEAR